MLRPATAADHAAVIDLLATCDLPADGLEHSWPHGYVVEAGNAGIEGVAGIETYGEYGLLRSVAVSPARRGTGLGDALVRERLEWSERQGLRAVYLLTTTAAEWFPRYGFVPVRRDDVPAPVRGSLEFASACPASAAVLARGAA